MKLEVIGVSIISPVGFAIKPLIPASCFNCAPEPLAPESDIINTELILFVFLVFSISFVIAEATESVHWDQVSILLLYFSFFVIIPFKYCWS